MSLLVHLVEPADWRAALDAGALRPPSLAGEGFVHLSTPDQVHLPAERLFPGRQDLVLLVVDPARLADPVLWAPGVPGPARRALPAPARSAADQRRRRRRAVPAARRPGPPPAGRRAGPGAGAVPVAAHPAGRRPGL